ncbi:MAG TPA: fluoride efflux transporter CrcB [Blastocatellia bacterium]|nr:fluoride efflux transporter CrcB [Blastocatellia bacterium]
MMKLLLVGAGGFLGSVARALLSNWVQQTSDSRFPFGTLAVNVVGCFVIGFLSQLGEMREVFSAEMRALLFVGVLGGFTTYSSFGNETINLVRSSALVLALGNVAAQLILGLGAVWLGRWLAERWW